MSDRSGRGGETNLACFDQLDGLDDVDGCDNFDCFIHQFCFMCSKNTFHKFQNLFVLESPQLLSNFQPGKCIKPAFPATTRFQGKSMPSIKGMYHYIIQDMFFFCF